MHALWTLFAFQLSCSVAKVPPKQLMVLPIPGENIINQQDYPVFGLDDALYSSYNNPSEESGVITLFSNACGNGIQNCAATCNDPEKVFRDLRTLHNCGVYRTISNEWDRGNLHLDNISFVKKLGFKKSSDDRALPLRVFNSIQDCLLASCEEGADCKPKSTKTAFANRYPDICSGFKGSVVPDVGGIGVFISYAMQMGLALLAFIFAVPWKSIMYAVYNICRTCLDVLSIRYKSSIAKERFRKSPIQKPYNEALTTALVDFQKAQCFFMLATNIAGLIMQKRGGLKPESFQQLYITYFFIKVIAIGGFLPITFTLLTLHMVHKLSWYLLTLSVATMGVAGASLKTNGDDFRPDSRDFIDIADIAGTGGPDACKNQKLSAFCYTPRTSFGPDFQTDSGSGKYIVFFCLITTVILIVDHFCRSTDLTQQKLNHRILKKLHITSEKPLFPYAKRVLGFGTAAFHFIFFCIYILCFYMFAFDLEWFRSQHVYEPTWGFGQIVAIIIFAPTLCDYFWNQTRGVEKGAEHRLPPRLEVRPRDNAGKGYAGGEAGVVSKEATLHVQEQEELV